ncbi:MAG: methyl-accepting chemotaxis protein [Lysinibacillus sp.]
MNFKSLKQRLLIVLLLTSMIPVLLTVVTMFWAINKSLDHLLNTQQNDMELAVETHIENETERLLLLAKTYAKNPEVVEAMQENEVHNLQQLQPMFTQLQTEHQLTVFELGNTSGFVHYRAHRPDNRGDNKSELEAIQQALQGKAVSGLEFGASGLAVRAFAPIQEGSKVIGSLQIGVDDSFLNELSEMFPSVTVSLLTSGGMVTRSSDEELLNQSMIKNVDFDEVIAGKLIRFETKETLQSFIPMYDPTGTEIIGAIHLTKDTSIIQSIFNMLLILAVIILIVTAVSAAIIATFYTKGLTKPITALVNRMERLRNGDLTMPIERTERRDEIGQLMRRANDMQMQLQNSLHSVADASQAVTVKGEVLTRAATDVQQGSAQIAETMEMVSQGAERQSKAVFDVSEIMSHFASELHETNEKGNELQHMSEQVTELSLNGSVMIQKSNEQMSGLHTVMQEAVDKMKLLNTQTAEVSKFVAIIENVANQTNLLALNASIEAARAGEHGKGFAVVAEEVRILATQVAQSVAEITTIVEAVQRETNGVASSLQLGFVQVEEGSAQMKQTTGTFQEITLSVETMQHNINNVIEKVQKMATDGQEISATIQEITAITEETSASLEETTATTVESSHLIANVSQEANELMLLADDLHAIVKQYKL